MNRVIDNGLHSYGSSLSHYPLRHHKRPATTKAFLLFNLGVVYKMP